MSDWVIALPFLGAALRFIDGAGKWLPNGVRVGAMLIVALTSGYDLCGLTWEGAWAASLGALALIVGQTDWEDWLWMPLRYALFGLAATWPVGIDAWPIPLAFALAGLCYPFLFWLDTVCKLPRCGWLDGPEAYARFPAGAVCLGFAALM